jgi:hypothetical protein
MRGLGDLLINRFRGLIRQFTGARRHQADVPAQGLGDISESLKCQPSVTHPEEE